MRDGIRLATDIYRSPVSFRLFLGGLHITNAIMSSCEANRRFHGAMDRQPFDDRSRALSLNLQAEGFFRPGLIETLTACVLSRLTAAAR